MKIEEILEVSPPRNQLLHRIEIPSMKPIQKGGFHDLIHKGGSELSGFSTQQTSVPGIPWNSSRLRLISICSKCQKTHLYVYIYIS